MVCPVKLDILVTAPEDLQFWFKVTGFDFQMSVEGTSRRTSQLRTTISSSVQNNDVVTVQGFVSCLTCGGNTQQLDDIVPRLKRLQNVATHATANLVVVQTPYGIADNCLLKRANVNANGNAPQRLNVTLEFEGENLAGTIAGPEFTLGGIQG